LVPPVVAGSANFFAFTGTALASGLCGSLVLRGFASKADGGARMSDHVGEEERPTKKQPVDSPSKRATPPKRAPSMKTAKEPTTGAYDLTSLKSLRFVEEWA
jgi:hypothetical protein